MDKLPSRARSTSASLARVSAIVVVSDVRPNASGQTPLDLCLRSALVEDLIDDLVIVDHGNSAQISSLLRAFEADRRDVKVIKTDASTSLAAAANAGAREALGRWLLFLGADVVLQRGAVSRMVAAAGDARAPRIVGGRLLDLEGRERAAARAGALNAFSAVAVAVDWPVTPRLKVRRDEAAKVAAVSGALMLMSRRDFNDLQGFDERFDGEFADLDLCRRAAQAGGSVLLQPEAAGVQFEFAKASRRNAAQGLALFAAKSAETPMERAFASIAEPALAVLLGLRAFVAGRPRLRR